MSNNDHRKTIGEWLSKPYEWRIPVYQRHYAWNPEDEFGPIHLFWKIVKDQATVRLDKKKVPPHYFGAILVESKPVVLQSTQKYDVVDGQQRLTTINVAMFAIIGIASQLGHKEEVQNLLAKYIFNDPLPTARKQPKLMPTNFDEAQFRNLLSTAFDVSPSHKDDSEQSQKSKVVQVCNFFKEEFKEFVKKKRSTDEDEMDVINALIDTMVLGFDLVLIQLEKTDEAQKVFESLNNTAKPLTTFDLIRNDIFYRADKEERGLDVELFHSPGWQQFEGTFWEETPGRSNKNSHVESYIARMLMAKKKRSLLLNRDAIFMEYKKFAEDEENKGLGVRAEIETLSEYRDTYKYLVGKEKTNPLGADFKFDYFMYAICKNMYFYPAIFTIANCDASVVEKQRMVSLLESYIIRRYICGLTSENYNIQGARICEALGAKPSYAKLDEFLKGAPDSATRTFPINNEVTHACQNHNFYKHKIKQYIFDRIVDYSTDDNYDEKRDTQKLTIDHIVPQGWREKNGWKTALKEFKEDVIDIKINTIGNLTLMSRGLNSAKSNRGWDDANGAKDHLKECDLKMTRKLADKNKWDIDDINERNEELAGIICKIWLQDIK